MTGDLARAVRDVDQALAGHPIFGDSTRILARVLGRYRFGVRLFAERLPEVAAALPALERLNDGEARRIFFDPVVRLALEAGFSDLEAGTLASPHRLEEVLPPRSRRSRSACAKRACAAAGASPPRTRSGCGTWTAATIRMPRRCTAPSRASTRATATAAAR